VSLKLDYLLASSALPFIFPAVKVHREYFGDGSVRQIAPISPALHLGADRVLVVGTGRQTRDQARARSNVYPSLAQVAGHALNSIFLDGLSVDLERLERINRTLSLIPAEKLAEANLPLRPVKVLFISPSQPLERIAARFVHELPRTMRFILRPTGALNRSGSNLASYLLFEDSFCRTLIDLGYQDTIAWSRRCAPFSRTRKDSRWPIPARRRTRSKCSAACGDRSGCRCPAWRCRRWTRRKSTSGCRSSNRWKCGCR
jgi:NTE family protein